MESSAIKLEPKIESGDVDLHLESNDGVEMQNRPSTSASLNAVTSSASQINNSDTDSEDCPEDVTDSLNSTVAEQVLEIVDIDSDASEENADKVIEIPRKAGLRQLKRRMVFKVNSLLIYLTIFYSERLVSRHLKYQIIYEFDFIYRTTVIRIVVVK